MPKFNDLELNNWKGLDGKNLVEFLVCLNCRLGTPYVATRLNFYNQYG